MSAQDHDESLSDERRLERRRWFEHAVMVPVGFGMVTTFVATGATHLAVALGAPSWVVDKFWPAAVLIALPGLAFILVRSARR